MGTFQREQIVVTCLAEASGIITAKVIFQEVWWLITKNEF